MARPTTALIVDDEAHVRTYVRLLLKEVGIESCWEAPEGSTALALTAQHNPGLVLLDLNMPGLNGLEVLAKLLEKNPDLPVVILTAQSAMNSVKDAIRLGAAGYILKQNPRSECIASLRELLESMDDEGEADAAETA